MVPLYGINAATYVPNRSTLQTSHMLLRLSDRSHCPYAQPQPTAVGSLRARLSRTLLSNTSVPGNCFPNLFLVKLPKGSLFFAKLVYSELFRHLSTYTRTHTIFVLRNYVGHLINCGNISSQLLRWVLLQSRGFKSP